MVKTWRRGPSARTAAAAQPLRPAPGVP